MKSTQYNQTAPKGALLYSLNAPDAQGAYHCFRLDLGRQSYWREAMVSLRFQATKNNAAPDGALDFYGFSVDTRTNMDSPEKLLEAAQLVSKLCKRHDAANRNRSNPSQWRETLKEAKACEVMHDNRTSSYVLVETVAPAEFSSWRDDWKALGNTGGCTVSAFARDEDEARAQMIVAAKSGNCYAREDFFAKWKEAGFPVIQLDSFHWGYNAPVTWENVLFLNGKQREVEAMQTVA